MELPLRLKQIRSLSYKKLNSENFHHLAHIGEGTHREKFLDREKQENEEKKNQKWVRHDIVQFTKPGLRMFLGNRPSGTMSGLGLLRVVVVIAVAGTAVVVSIVAGIVVVVIVVIFFEAVGAVIFTPNRETADIHPGPGSCVYTSLDAQQEN